MLKVDSYRCSHTVIVSGLIVTVVFVLVHLYTHHHQQLSKALCTGSEHSLIPHMVNEGGSVDVSLDPAFMSK